MSEIKYSSVRLKVVDVNGDKMLGIEIDLPDSPPLVVLRGSRGFVMCGYLDISAAERQGAIAAKVRGVRSVEEMLEREVSEATSRARERGIVEGARVKDIIKFL